MPANTARELWDTVLGSLQLEVNRHNYDTWLKKTIGLEMDDSSLTVGVPTPFVAESLERRLASVVHKTVNAVSGHPLQVEYRVFQPWAQDAPSPSPFQPASQQAREEPSRAPRLTRRSFVRGTPLNPSYTFDTFIVGKSNRFAHAAAMAISENPGKSYNPLFIHSGVGLGKTHLLHAIAHAAAAKRLECLYVSAEQFTNDFVTALREHRAEEFRDKYRTTDILLIDDIQFIAGKEHSKESFFHTFNDLHGANKQIVITSDARPKSIPLVEERLVSRFEGGLIADIQPPELETRVAILQTKAGLSGLKLSDDVAELIARKILRNVRELEGALNRLLAMARLSNRALDLDLAQQAIADIPSATPRRRNYAPSTIIDTVALFYRVDPVILSSKTRKKEVAHARQVAAYLLREETDHSLADVGRLLGERGHTTVLRAHDKIAYELNVNPDLRHEITEIRGTLEDRRAVSA